MKSKHPLAPILFVFTNSDNWVIASSPEEANELYESHLGESSGTPKDWLRIEEDRELTISFEDPKGYLRCTLTARQWCAIRVPGYLGSEST